MIFKQLEQLTQQLDAQDGRGGTTYSDHISSLLLEALTNLDARIASSMSPVAEQVSNRERRGNNSMTFIIESYLTKINLDTNVSNRLIPHGKIIKGRLFC